jgi:hypothetical protein
MINLDAKPLPCPKCGKTPSVEYHYDSGGFYEYEVVCRKWFGILKCNNGPISYESARRWIHWGKASAIHKWNEQVGGPKLTNLDRWLLDD